MQARCVVLEPKRRVTAQSRANAHHKGGDAARVNLYLRKGLLVKGPAGRVRWKHRLASYDSSVSIFVEVDGKVPSQNSTVLCQRSDRRPSDDDDPNQSVTSFVHYEYLTRRSISLSFLESDLVSLLSC